MDHLGEATGTLVLLFYKLHPLRTPEGLVPDTGVFYGFPDGTAFASRGRTATLLRSVNAMECVTTARPQCQRRCILEEMQAGGIALYNSDVAVDDHHGMRHCIQDRFVERRVVFEGWQGCH
jgi:hypothetical protein